MTTETDEECIALLMLYGFSPCQMGDAPLWYLSYADASGPAQEIEVKHQKMHGTFGAKKIQTLLTLAREYFNEQHSR